MTTPEKDANKSDSARLQERQDRQSQLTRHAVAASDGSRSRGAEKRQSELNRLRELQEHSSTASEPAQAEEDAVQPETRNSKLGHAVSAENDENDDDLVGAVAVPGIDARSDSSEYTDEQEWQSQSQTNLDENANSPAPLTVLDGHLPSPNNGNDLGDILVVDGVREPLPENHGKRRRTVKIGLVVCVVIIGAATVGAVFGTKHHPKESLYRPTPAPSTRLDLKNDIRLFLARSTKNGSDMFDPDTPQSMAADWIVDEDPLQVALTSPKLLQRFALVLFYYETTSGGTRTWTLCGPTGQNQGNVCNGKGEMKWLTGTDECTWYGIVCDEKTGAIEALSIRYAKLTGPLPSAFVLLKDLVYLDFIGNSFTGNIPEELYDLTQLTFLQLVGSVTGTISTRIGLLTRLSNLNYGANNLSGTIPSEIGKTQLSWLGLAENVRLFGSVPEELYDIPSLTYIALMNLSLAGTLSTRIGKLTLLEEFHVYGNRIRGTLPSEIGQCSWLTKLDVSENALTGRMPSEVGQLRLLERLFTDNNKLSGVIPEVLFDLTNLQVLSLGPSNMEGTISTKVGRLTSLLVLGLGSCNLSGTIPTEIGLLSALNRLILQQNQFTGNVPVELFGLLDLSELTISINFLTGTVSTLLGRMSNLDLLSVFENILSGTIPTQIGNLSALQILLLDQNGDIDGTIPDELFALRQLRYLSMFNTSLQGTLSSYIGELTNLESNPLTGTVPYQIANLHQLQALNLDQTLLLGVVSDAICNFNFLTIASADCLPTENPPMPCSCCTICCNRVSGECTNTSKSGP